eukprot:SAG22_NODE_2_length_61565_cov_858.782010_4_plen_95_part_00
MLFGRNITFKLLDGFVFETAGPEGIRTSLGNMAVGSVRFQNGFIPNYASMFFFGVLLLVGGFVLAPKVILLIPSFGIYSAIFAQSVPVLFAILI